MASAASVSAGLLRSSKSATSLHSSNKSRTNSVFSSSSSGSAASSKRGSPSRLSQATTKSAFLSTVEEAMLRSDEPIEVNESEEISVIGNYGVWMNKEEVTKWKGLVPIEEYQINEDDEPEIITKRSQHQIEYVQELAIRYLRPPTPPAPGEIVITQEANKSTGPAPPLIIRQQPPRPETPEPLIIREAPPEPPMPIGIKKITISGKMLPPPPRKVVIERLAALPSKPQPVIVERWLPYSQVKRRVIFNKAAEQEPVIVKPKNIIVQWEAPQVQIKKEYKYLGVITANPVEYVQTYGSTLKNSSELPEFVLDIKAPEGLTLAADYKSQSVHELEGDLHALKLIDLNKEGLGQYSEYVKRIPSPSNSRAPSVAKSQSMVSVPVASRTVSVASSAVQSAVVSAPVASRRTSVIYSNFFNKK